VDPQRYARVKQIFREAMRWEPAERAAAVRELAGDDADVRDEVMSLLAHHDDAPLIRAPAQSIVRIADAAAGKTGQEPAEGAAGGGAPAPAGAPAAAPPPAAASAQPRRPLAELLRTERAGGAAAGWSLDRVVYALEPVVEALARIADAGGVHGAVRADRLVVVEDGGETVVRIPDVDIEAAVTAAAASSAPPGPPKLEGAEAASAAPEQLLPALGPVGPWTDVYALALLCVELMLGRPLVEGSAAAALARTRDETAPPTPRSVGLAVRGVVEAVMAMALAMRPMERYQNVRRFWTALREALDASRRTLPTLQPSSASLPIPPGPSALARPRARDFAGGRARLRWRVWAAVIAAVVAAAAIAIAASRC
jgi:hypothetical protein